MAKRLSYIVPGSNHPPPKHHSNDSKDINTSVKYRSDGNCPDSQEKTVPVGAFEVSGSAVVMNLDAEICAVCFKIYANDECLMQHMESAHALEDDSVVGCIICYEEFESFKDLTDHIKQHPKNCDKCQIKFLGHKQLLLHYRKVHAKNIRKKHKSCPDCLMKFDSKSGYLDHLARRHDKKICSRIKEKKNSTPLAISQTDNNVNKLKNGASLSLKNNQRVKEKISDQKAVEDTTHSNRLVAKDLASPNKIISENNHSKSPQGSASCLNLKSAANSRNVTKTVIAKEVNKEEKMNGVCATPLVQVNTQISPPKISPPKSCEKKAESSFSDADKKSAGSAAKKVFVESPDFAASLCPTLQSLSSRPKVLKTGNILPELLNLSASQRKQKRVIKKFEKSLQELESSISSKSASSSLSPDSKKLGNASVNSKLENDPEILPLSSSESSKLEKSALNLKPNGTMKAHSPPTILESKKIGKVPRLSDSSIISDDLSSIKTESKKVKKIIVVARKSDESKKIMKLSNGPKLTSVNSSSSSKSEVKLIETFSDPVEPAIGSEINSLPAKPESVKQRLHRAVMTALPAKFLSKSVDEIAPESKLNGCGTTQSSVTSKKTETSPVNSKPDDCAQSATPSTKSDVRKRPKRKASEGLSWKSLLRKNEVASSEEKPCNSSKSLQSKPVLNELKAPSDSADPDYAPEPSAESEVTLESSLSKRPERPKRIMTSDLVSANSEVPVNSELSVETSPPEAQKAPKRNIIVALPSKSFARKTQQVSLNSKSHSDLQLISSKKEDISPSSSEPDLVFEVSLSTPESQKKRGTSFRDQQVRFNSDNDLGEIEEEPENDSKEETVEPKVDMILELKRRVSMELSRKLQSLGVTRDSLDAGTSQSCSLILPPNSDSAKIFPKNDKKIVSMEQCLKEYESKNKPVVVTKKSIKKGRKAVPEESDLVSISKVDDGSDALKESSNLKLATKKIKGNKARKQIFSVSKEFDSGDDADRNKFEATNARDNTKTGKSAKSLSVNSVVDKHSGAKSKKNNSTKISKIDSSSAGDGISENILEKNILKSSRNKPSINENRRKRKASETSENTNCKLSKILSSSPGESTREELMEVSPSVNVNESELLSQSLPNESFNAEPSKRRTSAKVTKNPVEKEEEEFQEEDLIQAIIDNLKQIKQSAANESQSQRQSCPYCEYSSHRISALESHLKLNILIRPNHHRTLILSNSALFGSKDSKNSQVESIPAASLVGNDGVMAETNSDSKVESFDNGISSSVLTSTPHQANDLLSTPVKTIDDNCPTPRKICKVSPKIRNLNETTCNNSFNSTEVSKPLPETEDSSYINGFSNQRSEESIKNLNLPLESYDDESVSDASEYSSIINSQPYVLLDDIGHLLPSVYERQSRENSDSENTPQKRNNNSASSDDKSMSYVDELFSEKEVTLETVCALCQEKFETNADLMSHILLHI